MGQESAKYTEISCVLCVYLVFSALKI